MSSISEWCNILDCVGSSDNDKRENAINAINHEAQNPSSFILLCCTIFSNSNSSSMAKKQALNLIQQILRPSSIHPFLAIQSIWFSIAQENRNKIKSFIIDIAQSPDIVMVNLACLIFALIFQIEGDSENIISTLCTMSDNLAQAHFVFKTLFEIFTELTERLDVIFCPELHQHYFLLISKAIQIILYNFQTLDNDTILSIILFLTSAATKDKIPSFFSNEDLIQPLIYNFPKFLSSNDQTIFRELHNLLFSIMKVNYKKIVIDDPCKLDPKSPFYVLIQIVLTSLTSNYTDSVFLNIVLNTWKEIAEYEKNQIEECFYGSLQDDKKSCGSFTICKSCARIILPRLYSILTHISPNDINVEDTESCITDYIYAAVTFQYFAKVDLEDAQQFCLSKLEESFCSSNWIIMHAFIIMITYIGEVDESNSFIYTFLTDYHGHDLILKCTSHEFCPHLRETALYCISNLISHYKGLITSNIFSFQDIAQLFSEFFKEIKNVENYNKTENYIIMFIRLQFVFMEYIKGWENISINNFLSENFDNVIQLCNLIIEVSYSFYNELIYSFSFEILTQLAKSVPSLSEFANQFILLLDQDFSTLKTMLEPNNVLNIGLAKALIDNIGSIILYASGKIICPYPIMHFIEIIEGYLNKSSLTSPSLVALGSLITWSNNDISPEFVQRFEKYCEIGLHSDSDEIVESTCLLIGDSFNISHNEIFSSLIFPLFQIVFNSFEHYASSPRIIHFLMFALAPIIKASPREMYIQISPQVFDLLTYLRKNHFIPKINEDFEYFNMYVRWLANLYSAFVNSYHHNVFEQLKDAQEEERKLLIEMQEFIKTFKFNSDKYVTPFNFWVYKTEVYEAVLVMLDSFQKITRPYNNTILNRAPAKSFLKILKNNSKITDNQIKQHASNTYSSFEHS